eukprot:m.73783 g.73783  ORF g.73783 m.73783 type:complete len:212 (+) comp8428_c0_seq3:126-761(+)
MAEQSVSKLVVDVLGNASTPLTLEETYEEIIKASTSTLLTLSMESLATMLKSLVGSNEISNKYLPHAQTFIYFIASSNISTVCSSMQVPSLAQSQSHTTPIRRPRIRKGFSTPRKSSTSSRIVASSERGVFSKAAMSQSTDKVKEDVEKLEKEIQELEKFYNEHELDTLIHKLHVYNDLKDVAQTVLGVLARDKGITTKEMYSNYDLNLED